MCRILSQLTRLLRLEPTTLEAHGASLKRLCEQQNIKCPNLAKAVVSLYLEVLSSLCVRAGDCLPLAIVVVAMCAQRRKTRR